MRDSELPGRLGETKPAGEEVQKTSLQVGRPRGESFDEEARLGRRGLVSAGTQGMRSVFSCRDEDPMLQPAPSSESVQEVSQDCGDPGGEQEQVNLAALHGPGDHILSDVLGILKR